MSVEQAVVSKPRVKILCDSCERYVKRKTDGLCPRCRRIVDSTELQDPILEVSGHFSRWYRRFAWPALVLFLLLIGMTPLILLGTGATAVLGMGLAFVGILFLIVFTMALMVLSVMAWWRAFAPRRPTDIFYLRSFKNDSNTWPIRVAIQSAVGGKLRLSGIRDPKKRSRTAAERFYPLFVAMRYCTPRFMDLEAGDDWRARLWNSLQGNRIAILDLSQLTPFLMQEIHLAQAALGTSRLIFLGQAPQTAAEIRRIVAEQIDCVTSGEPLRIIIWPGSPANPPTREALKNFTAEIEQQTSAILREPELKRRESPATFGEFIEVPNHRRQGNLIFNAIVKMQLVLLVLQLAVSVVLSFFSGDRHSQDLARVFLYGPFILVNLWFLLQNWLIYIYDVGVWRDRIKASIALAFVGSVTLGGIFGVVAPALAPEPVPTAPGASSMTEAEVQDRIARDRADLRAEDMSQ